MGGVGVGKGCVTPVWTRSAGMHRNAKMDIKTSEF